MIGLKKLKLPISRSNKNTPTVGETVGVVVYSPSLEEVRNSLRTLLNNRWNE